MAWATPPTIAATAVLPSAQLQILSDNEAYLLARPTDEYLTNEGSDYTTTNTSFEDVDLTNLSLTIVTNGGDVLVGLVGFAQNSSTDDLVCFDIDIDGARHGGDDGLWSVGSRGGVDAMNASAVIYITGLSAASHTFKLQWKVFTGTATLYAGAGTSERDVHSSFWVKEL